MIKYLSEIYDYWDIGSVNWIYMVVINNIIIELADIVFNIIYIIHYDTNFVAILNIKNIFSKGKIKSIKNIWKNI